MNERHTISGLNAKQKHNCLELSNQFFFYGCYLKNRQIKLLVDS
jgi:hypothetical protein